ncbi:APC family permease [Streptomyces sp. NPDC002088]|uniref:APC family permease n=1 Tax=Streptomyces sp. NPDC002088 TaxID=3154665 RepID=UPI00332360D9
MSSSDVNVPPLAPTSSPPSAPPSLASNALSALEAFGQSLAATGPSIAIAGTVPVVFLDAGTGTLYSLLAGTVIVLLVAYVVAQFARRAAGAGSLYGYVALGLGRVPAFAGGWGLVVGYTGIAAACLVGAAMYLGAFLDSVGVAASGTGGQLALLAAATVVAVWYPVRGAKLSSRIGIVLEVVSLAAIVAALVATAAHFGLRVDTAQFTARGADPNGVMLGTVLAVTIFVGFESAGSLGSEARDPYRSIPRAMLGTVLGAGVLYLLSTYIQVIGFTGQQGLASSAAPLNEVARSAGVEWLTYVLNLGIAVSAVACGAASVNAAARGLYSLSREGVLPAALSRVHPRFRTPHTAIVLLGTVAGVVPLALIAAGAGELDVYAWTATFGTFGYLLAYLLVVLAVVPYLRRRGELTAGPVVAGGIAALAILYVIYKNLVPVPTWPVSLLPYLFAAVVLAGLAWYGALHRRDPERARRIGTLVRHADAPGAAPEPGTEPAAGHTV